ncbi:glycoside hydrolase family 32 protein [Pontibacter qinzhouensis]|uniref:Glycoside hydrolase family 32 protein n=1 Tax=Pontibacter qinzhouensis TaxID=2603253 RepID=A0A5C8K6S0_9BACT|nr:glycoside hydrolase family 32 protein [Pontibacter qinzhouensis]TXK46091.1 glycoside hydrolase family 32 protein [Pontibacter qinzhouensis]
MKIKQVVNSFAVLVAATAFSCNSGTSTTETAASENPQQKQQFDEQHRSQFHFTPPAGWMNDPNGMVYHKGEYHLFYQHNPDTTIWAPMHWGHAVSKDMIHWEHLPIALYPDSLGMIFSGSAVVDVNNTSGLGTKDNPALVAIYTYHNMEGERAGRTDFQTQGLAYSLDNGRSWQKHQANPVLKNPGIRDFRDPKVAWYEAGKKWIMTLAVADHISFYSSKNLLDWKLESDFGKGIGAHGGVWECPDLFKLPVEGSDQEKWVLLVSINPGGPNGGSATQYFIGDFDGSRFVMDRQFETTLKSKPVAEAGKGHEGIWLDYGRDNYAGVTWANVPEQDGRRLFMGWMSNWDYANVVPSEKWRSAMTIARTLSLENTPAGLRVVSKPVKELESYVAATNTLDAQTISDSLVLSDKFSAFDLSLELEPAAAGRDFAIELSNGRNQKVLVGYNASQNQYYIDRTNAGDHSFSDKFGGIQYGPRIVTDKSFNLRLVVDVASVELFADGGKTTMTAIYFPDEPFTTVRLVAAKGAYKLSSGKIVGLKSIWNPAV